MKKKLAMRIASLALCIVFVGALFGVPKAKAVAVEAVAVSIGAAVLSSYLIATNMDLIGDTAETISNGISSLVSDWVTASGVADSGDSWLSELGTAVSVRNPGVLIVPGALAAGCAAFVSWLTETFGLDEDGVTTPVFSDTADSCTLLNGAGEPFTYEFGKIVYTSGDPYLVYGTSPSELFNLLWDGVTSSRYSISVTVNRDSSYDYILSFILSPSSSSCVIDGFSRYDRASATTVDAKAISASPKCVVRDLENSKWVFCSGSLDEYGYYRLTNVVSYSFSTFPWLDNLFGSASSELSVTRSPDFFNIANNAKETNELAIYTALPGVTLEELAADIPTQIAAGTLAPTAELTQTGEGTGEGEGTDDDTVIGGDSTTVGLLQSILNRVKAIPESISTSIADVFTPSQEAVDSLSAEVDAKLPFIPDLKDFGSDLVYNLEHPEACVDGLGLTTVVDLGKGRGTYLGDTTHDLLDVSWYLEYKPLVDDLIVGFCWLVFLWNCYGALPRIIHGEGSTITVNAMDFPTVNDGSLSQKSLGPSDGSSWGPDSKWKMW